MASDYRERLRQEISELMQFSSVPELVYFQIGDLHGFSAGEIGAAKYEDGQEVANGLTGTANIGVSNRWGDITQTVDPVSKLFNPGTPNQLIRSTVGLLPKPQAIMKRITKRNNQYIVGGSKPSKITDCEQVFPGQNSESHGVLPFLRRVLWIKASDLRVQDNSGLVLPYVVVGHKEKRFVQRAKVLLAPLVLQMSRLSIDDESVESTSRTSEYKRFSTVSFDISKRDLSKLRSITEAPLVRLSPQEQQKIMVNGRYVIRPESPRSITTGGLAELARAHLLGSVVLSSLKNPRAVDLDLVDDKKFLDDYRVYRHLAELAIAFGVQDTILK